jgi:hypothetical protein
MLRFALDGEAAWNAAFDEQRLAALALNNRGACTATACGSYEGGDLAFAGRVALGSRKADGRFAWSASLAYRHVESDAVLDAFNDTDFGLGGTNLRGFVATAGLGLGDGVTASLRWSTADAIAGPPFSVDVGQADLQVRF